MLAVLAFLLAAMAVNQEKIGLQFLAWQTPQWSVFWWLLIAFFSGLLLGVIGYTVSVTRLSLRNRRLTRELSRAQQELRRP